MPLPRNSTSFLLRMPCWGAWLRGHLSALTRWGTSGLLSFLLHPQNTLCVCVCLGGGCQGRCLNICCSFHWAESTTAIKVTEVKSTQDSPAGLPPLKHTPPANGYTPPPTLHAPNSNWWIGPNIISRNIQLIVPTHILSRYLKSHKAPWLFIYLFCLWNRICIKGRSGIRGSAESIMA